MSSVLSLYFKDHSFPTVRSIIVPEHGHGILRCCPEARKVICNKGNGSKIITTMAKWCRKVEIVEGIDADKNYMKRTSLT